MVNSDFAIVDLATALFTYNLLIFMLFLSNTQEPGNQAAQRPARRLTIQPRVGMKHPAKVTGREGSSCSQGQPAASIQPNYRHSVWGWGGGSQRDTKVSAKQPRRIQEGRAPQGPWRTRNDLVSHYRFDCFMKLDLVSRERAGHDPRRAEAQIAGVGVEWGGEFIS